MVHFPKEEGFKTGFKNRFQKEDFFNWSDGFKKSQFSKKMGQNKKGGVLFCKYTSKNKQVKARN
ncbi:MAG: hypothetical protein ACOX05_01285 [Bacillota bacterium]|jgi:hypothetical protein